MFEMIDPKLQEMLHTQNDELHNVVALLDAAAVQELDDARLILMAIEKVQAFQAELQPYI